ncbi:MAG: hypothetical protein ACQESC_04070 [Nanobdellota archaeon]
MKTKYMIFTILAMLVITLVPLASAIGPEEKGNQEIDQSKAMVDKKEAVETENRLGAQERAEAKRLQTEKGRKLQMLSLEKSIMRNVHIGEQTIEYIESEYESQSTEDLQQILINLKSILDEVQSIESTVSENNTVQKYSQYKTESTAWTGKFKRTISEILTEDDRENIMGSIHEDGELKALNENIREQRKELNAQRVRETLETIGHPQADKIVQQIRSGSAGIDEAKQAVRQTFGNMTVEQRKEKINAFKRERIQQSVGQRNIQENIKKQMESVRERIRAHVGNESFENDSFAKNIKQELGNTINMSSGQNNVN